MGLLVMSSGPQIFSFYIRKIELLVGCLQKTLVSILIGLLLMIIRVYE